MGCYDANQNRNERALLYRKTTSQIGYCPVDIDRWISINHLGQRSERELGDDGTYLRYIVRVDLPGRSVEMQMSAQDQIEIREDNFTL